MDVSAKAYKSKLKEHGVFHTDKALAMRIREEVGVVREVYDPTCGVGSLLAVFSDDVKKYGQELEAEYLEDAKNTLINFTGLSGDTLSNPAFMDRKFESIVANPPFSVKWNPVSDERFADAPCLPPPSKADWAFILHCWYMLSKNGIASILCFPGALYRGQREGKIREWLVRQNAVEKVVHFEGGHFQDTAIATSLLVLRKGRLEKSTIFVDNSSGLEYSATFSEIENNGFDLSVSRYIHPPEEEKSPVDPWSLEVEARKCACIRLENEIRFSKAVASIEGWSIEAFIEDLQKVIDKYKG